jgi:tetratricopeptide (TPR) repeat protein
MYKLFLKISFALLLFNCSCKKQNEWLDVSNDQSMVIPKTLKDFQAILDDQEVMNEYYPVIGLLGSDNHYIRSADIPMFTNSTERNSYTWAKDIYENSPSVGDWSDPYKLIASANIVLEGLEAYQNNTNDPIRRDEIKGAALFFRSFSFYNLALAFSEPYDSAKAPLALGIPVRLTSDVNVLVGRATMEQTYKQITDDLTTAVTHLPDQADVVTRPTKAAAHALLAKVYLTMGKYGLALTHADKALQSNSFLQDFNSLSTTIRFPFPALMGGTSTNKEIIFHARSEGYSRSISPYARLSIIDSSLYASYINNDLRRSLFYALQNSVLVFKGTYNGSRNLCFGGLATNELFLIRAECYAREGNKIKALQDLNTLLKTRFVTNSYTDLQSTDPEEVLRWILTERRKELPFTGQVRWDDLRRLNKDLRFAITLKRIVNGTEYLLPPNDPRYALPIPEYEIQMNPMPQNPR